MALLFDYIFTKTIRLFALNFEGEARVNYHLIEISSS